MKEYQDAKKLESKAWHRSIKTIALGAIVIIAVGASLYIIYLLNPINQVRQSTSVNPTSTFDSDTMSRYQGAISQGVPQSMALKAAIQYQQNKQHQSATASPAPTDYYSIGQELKLACPRGGLNDRDSDLVGRAYVNALGVPTDAQLKNIYAINWGMHSNDVCIDLVRIVPQSTRSQQSHCVPDYAGGMNCN